MKIYQSLRTIHLNAALGSNLLELPYRKKPDTGPTWWLLTRQAGAGKWLLDAIAEFLCLGDELGADDGSFLVNAVGADHAALFAALVAVEESAQGGKRTVELVAVCVRHREDVVEPLVREIRIDDHRAVDERLELCAD